MERNIKEFKSITSKCYEDVRKYFGEDYEQRSLILMSMDGDDCSTAMIGTGETIKDTLVNAMLEDDKVARLVAAAVKEYKIAKFANNVDPKIVEAFLEGLKKSKKNKENTKED